MAERVYIKTTLVSSLIARPHRDVVFAGHQQLIHAWWETRRESYELCMSPLVHKVAGRVILKLLKSGLNG